jgi:hypothetical protein
MELLDVPPEIFQRIISNYVTIESPRKAARARTVCSKARFISEAIHKLI